MRPGSAIILAVLALGATPSVGFGAPRACFEVADQGAAGRSSSRRVTLASQISTQEACEYALDAHGPWLRLANLAASATATRDFATLLVELGGDKRDTPPRAIYARPGSRDAHGSERSEPAVESVFLAGCTEYLLSRGRGFEMRVPVDVQKPEVHRIGIGAGDDCGASALALRFVALPAVATDESPVPVVRRGPWTTTLALGQTQLALDAGRWGVYATRGAGDAGFLVGRLSSGSSQTPLRTAIGALAAQDGGEPWLRATWAKGYLQLEPVSAALAAGDAWAELRTAAAAGALWLARETPQPAGDSATLGHAFLGGLGVERGGAAIAFPSAPVEARMAARYGHAASNMTPSLADWRGMYDGLSVCLAGRYAPQGLFLAAGAEEEPPAPPPADAPAEAPRPVPAGAGCVPLAKLVAPLSVRGGRALAAGQICVRRKNRVMTAAGVRAGPELGERCVALPSGGEAERLPEFLLASVGDELTFGGVGNAQLVVCTDNECRPAPASGEWLPLEQGGLVEVRHVERPEQAHSRLGLTLVRIGVIDAAKEWHPIGLYDYGGTPPDDRWTTLDHDEVDVFAYVRRQQSMRFGLSVSPALAAAWNARASRRTRMTPDLPLVTPTTGELEAPPASALVVLPTRSAACPNAPASEVREHVIDPDRLVVDERFHLHLAHYRGEKAPYDCLATAGFRVTESLTRTASPSIRLGLLGDVQALVLVTRNRPAAIGLAAPIAYGRWRWGLGVGLDLSASLTSAVALHDAELTRAGLGVSAMVTWGPERYAPRLLGIGLMLHASAGSASTKEPTASFVTALNLSTLVDLAGGR